jgi:hypothetical protein
MAAYNEPCARHVMNDWVWTCAPKAVQSIEHISTEVILKGNCDNNNTEMGMNRTKWKIQCYP